MLFFHVGCDILFPPVRSRGWGAEVLILEELQLCCRRFALELEWQKISGVHDCNSFLDFTVRVGLKLYVLDRMQTLFPEQPVIASALLREALRARFIIELDLDFTSRTLLELYLSMLEFLLENFCQPKRKASWQQHISLV